MNKIIQIAVTSEGELFGLAQDGGLHYWGARGGVENRKSGWIQMEDEINAKPDGLTIHPSV